MFGGMFSVCLFRALLHLCLCLWVMFISGILNDKLIETKPSVVCGLYLGSLLAYTIIILLALLHWFNGGEIGVEYEPFLIILGIGAFALDFRMRKTFKISE